MARRGTIKNMGRVQREMSDAWKARNAAIAEIEQRIEKLDAAEQSEVQPVAESNPAKAEKRSLPEINGMLVRVVDPLLAATEQKRYKLNDKPLQCYSTMKQCCEWLNDPKRAAHELELLGHKFVASLGWSAGVIIIDTDGEPIDPQWQQRFVICYRTRDADVKPVKAAKPKMTESEKANAKAIKDAAKSAKRLADQAEADKARAEVAASRDAGLSALVQAFIVNVSSPEDQIAAPCRDALMTLARFGVIKSDGTVDLTNVRQRKSSTGGSGRGGHARRGSLWDIAATRLVMACGKLGLTKEQARAWLASHDMSVSEVSLAVYTAAGAKGQRGGAPALTDEQQADILRFK